MRSFSLPDWFKCWKLVRLVVVALFSFVVRSVNFTRSAELVLNWADKSGLFSCNASRWLDLAPLNWPVLLVFLQSVA